MRNKKTDSFITTNTPDTIAAASLYSVLGTQAIPNFIEQLVDKRDLNHLKEIVELKIESVSKEMESLKGIFTNRETRFWIINGIIIATLTAIFLFALPEIYKSNEKENIKNLSGKVDKIESRVQILENSTINITP